MDLVDKMREEATSGHVAYTEFILKLKKRPNCLFCFFEGKDDSKYYGIRIESITKKEFEAIDCGGKENVIAAERLISSKKEYKNISLSYFIDQDYDEHIKFKNIYCLPSYSIENQYSNRIAFQKILKQEFSLKEDDEDFQKAYDLFESRQSDYHNKTCLVNAWLACQNDKRTNLGVKTHLQIDATIGNFFSSIINQDLQLSIDLSEINTLDKIQSFFPNAPIITKNELNKKLDEFKVKNKELSNRGKFELRFFVNFLERLKSEICKKQPLLFNKKHKCSLRFEYSSALTNLSIYANTPECLHQYLKGLINSPAFAG